MTMKARINTFAFRQTDLDSARLSVLGTIAHPIREPAVYLGSVLLGDVEIGRFRLRVEKEYQDPQVDVDLASFVAHRRAAEERGAERDFAMRAGGYLVLYVSEGPGGYQVFLDRVAMKQGEKVQRVFDNRFLMPEDVFVTTLLRPGLYTMSTHEGDHAGSIRVTYPDPSKGRYVPDRPANVSVTKDG